MVQGTEKQKVVLVPTPSGTSAALAVAVYRLRRQRRQYFRFSTAWPATARYKDEAGEGDSVSAQSASAP